MSEICCTRLAGNTCTGRKKSPSAGTIAQLCRAISSQLMHVSTIGKNLLNSNTSSTCSYNMANFGPLTAEIGSGVWGTPANFNVFRVFAALQHDTSGRQPNFAALNRRRHLHSAGRPSRWALAHILVLIKYCLSLRIIRLCFQPIAFESLGPLNSSAIEVVQR